MSRAIALTLCLLSVVSLAVPARADPVVRDGPVHQLRIYRIYDQTRVAFHDRFRDHAARIMAGHGFDIVAMWESRSEEGPEFVYLLRWQDEATMKAAWERFMADPEWAAIKRATAAEHGQFVGDIEDRTLQLVDYSPPGRVR